MTEHPTIQKVLEAQSGNYPLDKLIAIEIDGIPIVCVFFADAEMDVFMVQYGPEEEIIIHAEGVTHITTAPFQLEAICRFYDKAQNMIEELRQYADDDFENWSGHEHLITRPSI